LNSVPERWGGRRKGSGEKWGIVKKIILFLGCQKR